MKISLKNSKRIITVIVNFYNNKREATRTLYSLTSKYQNISQLYYKVIAIDNNSSEPLGEDFVKSFGSNFQYINFINDLPSPCKAINYAVKLANTPYVVICIDGARILSPGILRNMISCIRVGLNPFIYTIGMHIGSKPQNFLLEEGYNQEIEDKLLETIDWKDNGYSLFKISSMALSSKNGFFSPINESNCFLIRKNDFIEIGGYDEKFLSKGGGLTNLDFFNRVQQSDKFLLIMLLGEATFHQFHGGVATNVLLNDHPWKEMEKEYETIRKMKYISNYRTPVYFGHYLKEFSSLFCP